MSIDRAPEAVEPSDLEERMVAYLEAEETEEPENDQAEPDGQPVEAEASESEEPEAEEAETEEPEPEYVELRWGDEVKKVTKDEFKNFAEQGYNVTQKLQAVAEKERVLQSQQQYFEKTVQIQTQLSDKIATVKAIDSQLEAYKQVDWQTLAREDTAQYLMTNQAFQQLKEARNEAMASYQAEAGKFESEQQKYRNELVQREARLLADSIPAFRGEQAAKNKAELGNHLINLGFSKDEVESLIDHRIAKMAWESMQYSKLQSAKPQVTKKLAEAPKVIKSKAPNAPNQQVKELRARAKRGDERAIQALIERTL